MYDNYFSINRGQVGEEDALNCQSEKFAFSGMQEIQTIQWTLRKNL